MLWKKTPIGKACTKRYKQGKAGKAAARRYTQGAAGKAAARRRAQSSKFKEYQRHYSKSSAGKARDRRYYQSSKGNAAYMPRLRSKALLKVGRGKIECAECGFKIQRGLDINHKNGDGKIDRQKYKNRNTFYTAIIRGDRSINDLMLLCKLCHQRFHFIKEYGSQFQEIQHQKKEVMPITL